MCGKIATGGTVQSLKPYINTRKHCERLARIPNSMEYSVALTHGDKSCIPSSTVKSIASNWVITTSEEDCLSCLSQVLIST